jgi:hypothetical protein
VPNPFAAELSETMVLDTVSVTFVITNELILITALLLATLEINIFDNTLEGARPNVPAIIDETFTMFGADILSSEYHGHCNSLTC